MGDTIQSLTDKFNTVIKPMVKPLAEANPTRATEIIENVKAFGEKLKGGNVTEAKSALTQLVLLLKGLPVQAKLPVTEEKPKTETPPVTTTKPSTPVNTGTNKPLGTKEQQWIRSVTGEGVKPVPQTTTKGTSGVSPRTTPQRGGGNQPRTQVKTGGVQSTGGNQGPSVIGSSTQTQTQTTQQTGGGQTKDPAMEKVIEKFNTVVKPVLRPLAEANPTRATEISESARAFAEKVKGGNVQEATQALVSLANLLKTMPVKVDSGTGSTPQVPPTTTPQQTPVTSTGSTTGQTTPQPTSQTNVPPRRSPVQRRPPVEGGTQLVPEKSPEVILREKNEQVKQGIETLNQRIASSDMQGKLNMATEAVSAVTTATPESLAGLSSHEQIQLLAKLKCHAPNGQIPEPQRKALAKIYGAIRLDKDFREHDENLRQQVLESLVKDPSIQKAREDWGKTSGLTPGKKTALKKAQSLQCAKLGFTPDAMEFGDISDGSSGVCSGKTVKVSTRPDAITDFNEVIDTVIHETTHAYQRFLVEELDAGRLTVDDPRYAQAWLFKLNDGTAYAKPPAKLSEVDKQNPSKKLAYDSDYLAYKRQPLEEHAWKAGNEAGRAFDVNAIGLEMAALTRDIASFLPGKASAAQDLLKKLQTRKSVFEGTQLVEEVDALAGEAYTLAEAKANELYPAIGQYVTGGFELYSGQWLEIANSKDNPRTKLKKMSLLARTLVQKTEQGKIAVTEFDNLWEKIQCTTQEELNEANRIGNLKVSKTDKLKQLKTSPKLAAVRKRAGLSV